MTTWRSVLLQGAIYDVSECPLFSAIGPLSMMAGTEASRALSKTDADLPAILRRKGDPSSKEGLQMGAAPEDYGERIAADAPEEERATLRRWIDALAAKGFQVVGSVAAPRTGITAEELRANDGTEGRPVWLCIRGTGEKGETGLEAPAACLQVLLCVARDWVAGMCAGAPESPIASARLGCSLRYVGRETVLRAGGGVRGVRGAQGGTRTGHVQRGGGRLHGRRRGTDDDPDGRPRGLGGQVPRQVRPCGHHCGGRPSPCLTPCDAPHVMPSRVRLLESQFPSFGASRNPRHSNTSMI